MAIAFVGDATGVDSNGGTFNVSLHASSAAGNVAIAALTSYDNTTPSITFTGWTQYRADAFSPSHSWVHYIYYRVLTGSDPVSVTLPAEYTTWYTATYSGADGTTPLVDTGSENEGGGTTVTGLGVTVTTDDSVLFASMVGYGSGLSVGFGSMTAREANYDSVNNFYDQSVSAGASGDRTATLSSNDAWSVTMGVIAPDGGGGGGGDVVAVPQSGLSFLGGMGGGMHRPRPPGKRDLAGSVQFARSKSGLYLPRRLAA